MALKENSTLICEIKDNEALQKAYMPFVKHGGIFIHTEKSFSLGEEVSVYLTLPEIPNPINFTSKVIWINPRTPRGSSATRPAGVGVQLPESKEGKDIKTTIERLLGEASSDSPGDTI